MTVGVNASVPLTRLRQIVQAVNVAQDLAQALVIMVAQVREVLAADACSIFLNDRHQRVHVLVATDGLNQKLTGKVRLPFGEGLIGRVAEREEPLNLESATEHPSFRHVPGVGEEAFHAFLGVPIVHRRQLVGVLTVQQKEPRSFDENEEAFLITLSAQLAADLAHAQIDELTWPVRRKQTSSQYAKSVLNGQASVPGVAMGQAVVVYPQADLDAVPEKQIEDTTAECQRFEAALQATQTQLQQLNAKLAEKLPREERDLFDAYVKILESRSFIHAVKSRIKKGSWAEGAMKVVVLEHVQQFEAMDDPYLAERATDIKELGQRVLSHLQAKTPQVIAYPQQTVLMGVDITPAALAEVPQGQLVGIVAEFGSANAHVAILARALGVPAVMGVSKLTTRELNGQEVIIDGYYGQVYLSPSKEIRAEFTRLLAQEQALDEALTGLRDLPATTTDDKHIALYANAGLAADISSALSVGTQGIGLYRTEMPFMVRQQFPTEEQQRIIYRQLLSAFAPRPVVMRTLDVGGDKPLPYFPVNEVNPFLGWRGIRLTLDHPEIYLTQLRAMLRASIGINNLQIMIPMVGSLVEIEETQRLLNQVYNELLEAGEDIQRPGFGVMIEVPAAVYQARQFARAVDFLSVGSNDLTQYILAVDRNNAQVAGLYDSLHPAVLQALEQVVTSAHLENKPVSICGELAGDPLAVPLLLAMGFDTLSMNAMSLPRIKWVIRQFSLAKAQALLAEVRQMQDPAAIRCHMELALEEAGCGGLIRAGN